MSGNVSSTIESEFRWETLFTRIKKSSVLIERIQAHKDPMLNFQLEKVLVQFMKTLTPDNQKLLESESLLYSDICPSDMSEKEFKLFRHELWLETQSSQSQYEYSLTFPVEAHQQKIKWLTKAAKKQNKDAQFKLAYLYDLNQDYELAVFLVQEGCKTRMCSFKK